jgi:low affinity Fe/Cu permease
MRPENLNAKGSAQVGTFTRFAQTVARFSGRPGIVIAAALVVAGWLIAGPFYRFSDTWLLSINTGTTVITFLMVFLIQHTQKREAAAVQLKLSELLLAVKGAENRIAAVEHVSDEELELLQEEYKKKSANPGSHPPQGVSAANADTLDQNLRLPSGRSNRGS